MTSPAGVPSPQQGSRPWIKWRVVPSTGAYLPTTVTGEVRDQLLFIIENSQIQKTEQHKTRGLWVDRTSSFSHQQLAGKWAFGILNMNKHIIPSIHLDDFEVLCGIHFLPVIEYCDQIIYSEMARCRHYSAAHDTSSWSFRYFFP